MPGAPVHRAVINPIKMMVLINSSRWVFRGTGYKFLYKSLHDISINTISDNDGCQGSSNKVHLIHPLRPAFFF